MHIGSSGEMTNPAPDGPFVIPIALGNVNAEAADAARCRRFPAECSTISFGM